MISKKTREQAADICMIAASEPAEGQPMTPIARAIGASMEALELALDAFWFLEMNHGGVLGCQVIDAEAESMIRDGWTP